MKIFLSDYQLLKKILLHGLFTENKLKRMYCSADGGW
jgi:hypothetical protein